VSFAAILVVPCYNEEQRIDAAQFLELAKRPGLSLLFVNDGSTDGTLAVLDELVRRAEGKIERLSLDRNRGKAEAVRRGLLAALARGVDVVGYADSDLATPPAELVRLLDAIDRDGAEVVLGSRVGLAGTSIERKLWRHMVGRVFATVASAILRARFYDTQCGAKVFRATDLLRAALAEPFHSRWAFDVELIGRMLTGAGGVPGVPERAFVEVPLQEWVDVQGSKLKVTQMAKVVLDLAAIHAELQKRRSP
jgi:glycosyltransferase involved in cell wall biosynthesis